MWSAPPGPLSAASGMFSTWPQWPPLAVAIGRFAVLIHAGDCSDLLSWQDGRTGGTETKARYTRIEPRAATSCEGLGGAERQEGW